MLSALRDCVPSCSIVPAQEWMRKVLKRLDSRLRGNDAKGLSYGVRQLGSTALPEGLGGEFRPLDRFSGVPVVSAAGLFCRRKGHGPPHEISSQRW